MTQILPLFLINIIAVVCKAKHFVTVNVGGRSRQQLFRSADVIVIHTGSSLAVSYNIVSEWMMLLAAAIFVNFTGFISKTLSTPWQVVNQSKLYTSIYFWDCNIGFVVMDKLL